jgi:hypothetical protein
VQILRSHSWEGCLDQIAGIGFPDIDREVQPRGLLAKSER